MTIEIQMKKMNLAQSGLEKKHQALNDELKNLSK